jgi:hypothetical protein
MAIIHFVTVLGVVHSDFKVREFVLRQASWDSRPVFFFNWTLAVIVLCNILSNERMGASFSIAAGPRQRGHSQVGVPLTHDHSLLSQILSEFRHEYWLGGLRRNTKASIRITGFRAEIRSWDLSNDSVVPIYCYRSSPAQLSLAPDPAGLPDNYGEPWGQIRPSFAQPCAFHSNTSLCGEFLEPCATHDSNSHSARSYNYPLRNRISRSVSGDWFLTGALSSTARSVQVFNTYTPYSLPST